MFITFHKQLTTLLINVNSLIKILLGIVKYNIHMFFNI